MPINSLLNPPNLISQPDRFNSRADRVRTEVPEQREVSINREPEFRNQPLAKPDNQMVHRTATVKDELAADKRQAEPPLYTSNGQNQRNKSGSLLDVMA